VRFWKNIRRGWRKFSSHTRFEVGNGSKVSFWHDLWCGDKVQKEVVPVLYGIACMKNASIVSHLEISGGFNQCNVSFARTAHD
jgi:hypothetical protein